MPASSKAQQRLMGLVKAVQAGDVPKSKVSKAVQKVPSSLRFGWGFDLSVYTDMLDLKPAVQLQPDAVQP